MRNDQIETPASFFEVDPKQLVEIPFVDQNGEDLGSFHVDRNQTVGEMIHEIVEESGLPTKNPDGSPKRYEGYQKGQKLPPTRSVNESDLESESPIEVYPSVVTGEAG
jgi:hypothetical protein